MVLQGVAVCCDRATHKGRDERMQQHVNDVVSSWLERVCMVVGAKGEHSHGSI